jgi:hypothetical protein
MHASLPHLDLRGGQAARQSLRSQTQTQRRVELFLIAIKSSEILLTFEW